MPAPEPGGIWTAFPAAVALGCVLTAAACEPRDSGRAPPPSVSLSEERLLDATDRLVAFLRGGATFDASLVADSVTLYIAPEGGGGSRRASGAELGNLLEWEVDGHRLLPPPGAASLTRRVGRHFNCMEYPLASRYEALARMPHVGTKLEPPGAESCMQSWNMTFVFAADSTRPVLAAVVYDQWEW